MIDDSNCVSIFCKTFFKRLLHKSPKMHRSWDATQRMLNRWCFWPSDLHLICDPKNEVLFLLDSLRVGSNSISFIVTLSSSSLLISRNGRARLKYRQCLFTWTSLLANSESPPFQAVISGSMGVKQISSSKGADSTTGFHGNFPTCTLKPQKSVDKRKVLPKHPVTCRPEALGMGLGGTFCPTKNMGKVKVHQWTWFFDWHPHPTNM